jgi:hypothetical protein
MQRIEVNVITGEQKVIDLTQEEMDAAQAQYQEWLASQPAQPAAPTLAELQARLATLTAQINSLVGA